MARLIHVVLILLLPTTGTFCQVTDTAFVSAAIRHATVLYASTIQGQTALFNGSEYKKLAQTNDQHPFYRSDDWVYGSVTYSGEFFSNVPLLYDITADRIITENYYNADELVLVNEKLENFSIGEYHFRKIKNEQVQNSLPASGFYEVLHEGPSTVVARRFKVQRERAEID